MGYLDPNLISFDLSVLKKPTTAAAPSKGQCQHAMLSTELPRCTKDATRKLGGHWFCEEHGKRS